MRTEQYNPNMVVLARESIGLTQGELARSVDISPAKLSKFENGLTQLAPSDITRISATTGFRPSFFERRDQIIGLGSSLLFNRRQKTAPVSVQRKVQARVNIARIQIERLLTTAEIDAVGRIERIDIDGHDGDPGAIAKRVRAGLKLPMGPIQNLTRAIESMGGVVVLCNFGTDVIDAAHIWMPNQPPMFFMNADRPGDRYRFNLAHELGHAVMHEYPTGDIEREANDFAAELLMPSDEIRREFTNFSIERAAQLKQRWKVSMSALIYHAHRLGCIGDRRRSSMYATLRSMLRGVREPIEIPVEQPVLFGQMVELHRRALGYTDEDLRELLLMDFPDRFIVMPNGQSLVNCTLAIDPEPLRFNEFRKQVSG